MPLLRNVLKVVDAFRRLDRAYLKFYSPQYPGVFHSLREISSEVGLPRTTVREVLDFLVRLGVVDRKEFVVPKYRLTVWEFDLPEGLHVEVELNRVIAYVS